MYDLYDIAFIIYYNSMQQPIDLAIDDQIVHGALDICVPRYDNTCVLLVAKVYYHSTLFIIQFS